MAPLSALPAAASTDGTGVVINEAYAAGGNNGAVLNADFVELYNPGTSPVDLSGWSIQYRSAAGTSPASGNNLMPLSGTIPAQSTFLVTGPTGANGAALPAGDLATTLAAGAAAGQIVLAKTTAAIAIGAEADPATVADFLGYGTAATRFEGTGASPATSVTASVTRTNFADSDNNAADFVAGTPTPTASGQEPEEPEEPGEPTEAAIADIQGTTDTSPLAGQTVTTTGVVTAAYPSGGFSGYYLQTPGTGGAIDAGHAASDGILVFSSSTVDSVSVGDYVQVTGDVSEFHGMTELNVGSAANLVELDASTVTAPAPVETAFPATDAEREKLEGMLVMPEGDFTVTDTYDTNKYAEVALAASTTPLVTPTALGDLGDPQYTAAQARIESELVVLDDGASIDFLPFGGGDNQDIPLPYLTGNVVRVGAPATFTKPVVLDYRNDLWKLQPTTQLTAENAATVQPVTFENDRPAAPQIDGGDIRLATFNVLNYFPTTGDQLTGCNFYPDRDGNPIAVADGCDARGAANAENLQRQQDKIVTAINTLGANVVSLEEIENSAAFGKERDFALSTLVDALNADLGSDEWDYVRSPAALPASEDVIRTAFIYKTESIETVGESTILTDSAAFSNARQPNAQAFKPTGGSDDDTFVVVANHLKSKGSGDDATGDNADAGNGAGAWNGDRTRQATDLVAFADEIAAAHETDKVFLVGDFNSYAAEDPIGVVTDAGYIDEGVKSGKYSYSFDSAVGSLDYIFASPEADAMVADSDIWNINSGESVALEYSRFNYNATDFYAADQYRSSDHDPVIVGLDLEANPEEPATKELNLLNINDFHGRIDANTVKFAGTVEQLKADHPDSSAFLSAGDNIGASLFASSSQQDQPTLDVLNALSLQASATGNHEFDQGYDDLAGRVTDAADFPYLAANVYRDGEPVFDEYTLLDIDGVSVGVIGAITEETPSLVSPGGIVGLEFGDPVEAVNRVADELSDGDPANGEADVIVAEYHEGSGAGVAEGATFEEQLAAGGAFADIVNDTSADVDAIFNGHTHAQYAWDAPVPGEAGRTRPVLQTGSYGAFIGQIVLEYDTETGEVTTVTNRNVPRVTTDDAALVDQYPAVGEVQTIVTDALEQAAEVGNTVIGEATADITTAFVGDTRDDRMSESTLGNFVADAMLATLSSPERGSAEIGVVNPGGLRAELMQGDITYAEANAVLPFLNNLWTTTLTGAQFKTVLEQQWQRTAAGEVPTTPYLQLGLSNNVSYTFDPTRDEGDRITSITVNGAPIDPARDYRIGSFNFLLQGGDNFREFANGTDTKDTGLVDRDAWIDYITANSPISPSYERRSVQVTGLPEGPVAPGDEVTLQLSKLDLTSLGVPVNTQLTASVDGQEVATAPVTNGEASLTFTVPEGADANTFAAAALASGSSTLTIVADQSGTTVTVPLDVTSAEVPTEPGDPGDNGSDGGDGNGDGNGSGDNGSGAEGPDSLSLTGAEIWPGIALMVMLLVAGFGSVLATRRARKI